MPGKTPDDILLEARGVKIKKKRYDVFTGVR
jgi:hypothetical protein